MIVFTTEGQLTNKATYSAPLTLKGQCPMIFDRLFFASKSVGIPTWVFEACVILNVEENIFDLPKCIMYIQAMYSGPLREVNPEILRGNVFFT
jgi:hypothetical protein